MQRTAEMYFEQISGYLSCRLDETGLKRVSDWMREMVAAAHWEAAQRLPISTKQSKLEGSCASQPINFDPDVKATSATVETADQQPLKIEAGKYYQTRDGRKAFVTCVKLCNPFAPNGCYTVEGGIEGVGIATWMVDGRYYRPELAGKDLVSEWAEPRQLTCAVYLVQNYINNEVEAVLGPRTDFVVGKYKILACKEIVLTEGDGMAGIPAS